MSTSHTDNMAEIQAAAQQKKIAAQTAAQNQAKDIAASTAAQASLNTGTATVQNQNAGVNPLILSGLSQIVRGQNLGADEKDFLGL